MHCSPLNNDPMGTFLLRRLAQILWSFRHENSVRKEHRNIWIHHSELAFDGFRVITTPGLSKERFLQIISALEIKRPRVKSYARLTFVGLGKWSNFYHSWIEQGAAIESVLHRNVTVLYRGHAPQIATVIAKSKKEKPLATFERLSPDHSWYFGKHYIVPEHTDEQITRESRPFGTIRAALNQKSTYKKDSSTVIVLRRQRSFTNTEVVLNLASQREDTNCVYLEDLSLPEQINLFKEAHKIIAMHGAGLTNILWCQANTEIIELFACAEEYAPSHYRELAKSLLLNYSAVYGKGHEWKNRQIQFPIHFVN